MGRKAQLTTKRNEKEIYRTENRDNGADRTTTHGWQPQTDFECQILNRH